MIKKSAYLIGIKGVAMTALAVYLKQSGYVVTGSDVDEVYPTDSVLKKNKIIIKKGFSDKNINNKHDVVVVTGAHGGMSNIEAQEAKKKGIPTFMHGEYLGKVMEAYQAVSIAGCHGKTTTSSLTASLLTHQGLDPSFAIGTAYINDLGYAGHFGKGKFFVAEADEYMTCPVTDKRPRFIWQHPRLLIITNIDFDHPDAYRDLEDVKNTFVEFVNSLDNTSIIVACIDDINIAKIIPRLKRKIYTYGFSPQADFRIVRNHFTSGLSFMDIKFQQLDLGQFVVHLPGKHNLRNTLASIIAANLLGVSWQDIKNNLKYFSGTKRRFEKIYEFKNITLYDDYAHHPNEIQSTLASFRTWFPEKRLIVIFQPHTYSRTKTFLSDFAKSFVLADLVIFSDIYPSAREQIDKSISSHLLAIKANEIKKNAVYFSNTSEIIEKVSSVIKQGDIILTMGAGDINNLHGKLIEIIKIDR